VIIGVNTRLLQKDKLEGIGWFTYETLIRITKNHPEHQFIFFFDRPFDASFIFSDNVKGVVLPPPTRHVIIFIPWFELQITNALKKHKVDLFLSPDGHLSLFSKVKSVAVIHDLNFLHLPQFLPKIVRWYYNYYFPKFAKKATQIATVSEYTKQDIVKSYGINSEKITVTFNGCNTKYAPISLSAQETVRQQFTNGKKYFLFIGLIIPRKNLVHLMLAFDVYKKQTGNDTLLVVIGEKKWWDTAHETTFQSLQYKHDVLFMGRLHPEILSQLLASAIALTYVPVFEGFGIPILEAFAAGTPVIAGNVTSMPEVAGDAALLVNPFNVADIADKMKLLSADENLRQELISKGLLRKTFFSWDKTAVKLWEAMEKAVKI